MLHVLRPRPARSGIDRGPPSVPRDRQRLRRGRRSQRALDTDARGRPDVRARRSRTGGSCSFSRTTTAGSAVGWRRSSSRRRPSGPSRATRCPYPWTSESPKGSSRRGSASQGVPTWIVVTPDLLECGRQEGVTTQKGWVEAFIQVRARVGRLSQGARRRSSDPRRSREGFRGRAPDLPPRRPRASEPRFGRLANDPKTPADVREQSLAYLASIELDAGRLDDATARLDTLIASRRTRSSRNGPSCAARTSRSHEAARTSRPPA